MSSSFLVARLRTELMHSVSTPIISGPRTYTTGFPPKLGGCPLTEDMRRLAPAAPRPPRRRAPAACGASRRQTRLAGPAPTQSRAVWIMFLHPARSRRGTPFPAGVGRRSSCSARPARTRAISGEEGAATRGEAGLRDAEEDVPSIWAFLRGSATVALPGRRPDPLAVHGLDVEPKTACGQKTGGTPGPACESRRENQRAARNHGPVRTANWPATPACRG